MITWDAYREAAQAYAAGVRDLVALSSAGTRQSRSGFSSAALPDLAERAETLLPLSTNLTHAAGVLLGHEDPLARAHAAGRLLAKALTDLQVSALLTSAAQSEEPLPGMRSWGRAGGPVVMPEPSEIEESLGIVLAEPPEPWPSAAVRNGHPAAGGGAPTGSPAGGSPSGASPAAGLPAAVSPSAGSPGPGPAAPAPGAPPAPPMTGAPVIVTPPAPAPTVEPGSERAALNNTVNDTLYQVREYAARAGQAALGGLAGMGLAEVAQAAGVVGLDIAKALGYGPAVTRLFSQVREFILSAYSSVMLTVGPAIAQAVASQVTAWVAELQAGAEFGRILDALYGIAKTAAALTDWVNRSPAAPEKFTLAGQALIALQAQFAQQANLIEKIARILVLAGSAPAALVPYGRLLLAATFVGLGTYVVLAGADFVDAPRLRLIDRVPGVRRILEADLGPLPEPAAEKTAQPGGETAAPATAQATPATAPPAAASAGPSPAAPATSAPAAQLGAPAAGPLPGGSSAGQAAQPQTAAPPAPTAPQAPAPGPSPVIVGGTVLPDTRG